MDLQRLVIASAFAILALPALAQPIQRSQAEVRAFRAVEPCPATGRRSGACPGWEVDHTVPLCHGGLDHSSNMVWLRKEDHAFKTRMVDIRECRKLKKNAAKPAGG